MRGHDDSKRRRRLIFGVILFVCLFFAQKEVHATEEFCREDLIRDAYERHTNNTEPFENQCTAEKYVSMERQLKHLVELRVKQKQPLTEVCMDHIKNFLCLQCSSTKEGGKPGSWSLCDSKCQGCKLLPLLVPQTSDRYRVCC